jgi:hypothetical protein
MMKTWRTLTTTVTLFTTLLLTAGVARAQDCQPGIGPAFATREATYSSLINTLGPGLYNMIIGMATLVDQPTYETLLADARTIANGIPNGRMVVTVPDGTVVLDTARTDDPLNTLPVGNSFAHFQAKTVNENHNSRIAILAAQEYPCGLGLESKLSTTTGQTETYLAIRLGNHLDSLGTARLSTRE